MGKLPACATIQAPTTCAHFGVKQIVANVLHMFERKPYYKYCSRKIKFKPLIAIKTAAMLAHRTRVNLTLYEAPQLASCNLSGQVAYADPKHGE